MKQRKWAIYSQNTGKVVEGGFFTMHAAETQCEVDWNKHAAEDGGTDWYYVAEEKDVAA